MTEVVLHVGMPKTATTTIQATLHKAAGALAAAGVLYPAAGRYNAREICHHAFFVAAASDRKAIGTPLPPPPLDLPAMARAIAAERARTGAGTVVLSSETAWNSAAFDIPALTRIRDTFPGAQFRVLAYLRPIESHITSGYAQRVSGPQLYDKPFAAHLQEALDSGRYDFGARLGQFAQVFGPGAVRPVWMPDLGGDILAPFRALHPALADLVPEADLNARRSWFYVAAARRLNRFHRAGLAPLCHGGRAVLARLDPFFRRRPALDRRFAPGDRATLAALAAQSARELAALRLAYGLGPGRADQMLRE